MKPATLCADLKKENSAMVPPRHRAELDISFPAIGCQKLPEVHGELKRHTFSEKCTAPEVADVLGEE